MPKNKKSQLNTIVRFSGAGIQMGVTIWLAVQAGKWLDNKYPNDKGWFVIICTLAGVALAMYSLITEANRINKQS